jgi:SHS2 domain-containing protein
MEGRYELLDHTADVLIRAGGKNMEEAFANAAYALFDTMCDAESVLPKQTKKVELEAPDLEQLLVDWLSRLLFMCDVDDMLFSEFDITITGTKLKAKLKGERLDPDRHHLKTDVKAITYHMLEVDEAANTVQVLFDI